ncbi:unnamed protein product [Mytilus edulis]|uniref:Uncharacterized protein n=1 Tax=Mytilus edulis TaxID=6550 RepID=A0A8S3SI56_MYTED|nr:unnamed protein product [Mytilus edulis]
MASNKNGKHELEGSDSESNLQQERNISEKTERPSRKRKLSERPTEGSLDPTKAPKLTEQIITGTTLLYCRSGIVPQGDVSQQSSLQTERTTVEQTALRDSTNLLVGPQLNELLLQHFDKGINIPDQNYRQIGFILSRGQKLGRWFYNVVDIIGINAEHRKACKEAGIMSEILFTFTNENVYYHTGSSIEGTFAPGEEHDYDWVNYNEAVHVVEDIQIPTSYIYSFSIITELTTPAGYYMEREIIRTLERFNKRILARYYYDANEDVLQFIQNLWNTLQRIIDTEIITEHTKEETQHAISSLLPHIYTCLACNIAVVAINQTNLKVRDFLLFGSFTYFMKGAVSGTLKWISVLYAIGLYEDCEWYMNQLVEEDIKMPHLRVLVEP